MIARRCATPLAAARRTIAFPACISSRVPRRPSALGAPLDPPLIAVGERASGRRPIATITLSNGAQCWGQQVETLKDEAAAGGFAQVGQFVVREI